MPAESFSFDEVLQTTVAVRKRLDFERTVEREVLMECFALANCAPSSRNSQPWHFVIVTEPKQKTAVAEIYGSIWDAAAEPMYEREIAAAVDDPVERGKRERMFASSRALRDRLHEVPVILFPCLEGRVEEKSALVQSLLWGSVVPAVWSFMLAARSRGLGTSWTSLHLAREKDVAAVLGIPFDSVSQVAMLPLAYTVGRDFKTPKRRSLGEALHWERW